VGFGVQKGSFWKAKSFFEKQRIAFRKMLAFRRLHVPTDRGK